MASITPTGLSKSRAIVVEDGAEVDSIAFLEKYQYWHTLRLCPG